MGAGQTPDGSEVEIIGDLGDDVDPFPGMIPPVRALLSGLSLVRVLGGASLGVVLVALIAVADNELPAATGRFSTPLPVAVLGLIIGLSYSALGVLLVAVYRRTRVVHFASVALGMVGSFGAAWLVVNAQWNYWAALIVAAVATGLGAALIGVGAHWRFPNRANANSSVTLPLALTLFIAAALIAAQTRPGAAFPSPPGLPTFAVGPLLITAPYMGLLIFAPALIVFTVVVDYWPARRWPVAVSWALVGVVACTVVLLAAPTLGFAGPDIGSIQLLPAMVVAGLAGFRRRGIAVVGGLALGVTEQYLLWNWPRSEATFWLFGGLLILSALIRTQRKSNALARHQLPPPPPREPRSAHRTRRVLTATVVTGAFIALGLTAILDHNPAQLILAAASASFCLVSSSQLATEPGRLELGLPGYMTVGILFGRLGTLATGNLLLPIALATLTGAITGAIIGRIARPSYSWRIPIVTLGVTLLAFASFSLLYDQGFSPLPLDLFGVMLNQSPRAWLWTSIALLALGLAAANRIGRRTPSTMNYAIAGAVAAVGGFAYSATLSDVDAEAVSLSLAFQLLAIALVGGTYAPLVPC